MNVHLSRTTSRRLLAAACLAVWTGSAVAAPLPSYAVPAAIETGAEAAIEPLNDLAANLRRQVVDFATGATPGTVVIDTAQTYL